MKIFSFDEKGHELKSLLTIKLELSGTLCVCLSSYESRRKFSFKYFQGKFDEASTEVGNFGFHLTTLLDDFLSFPFFGKFSGAMIAWSWKNEVSMFVHLSRRLSDLPELDAINPD